MYDYGLIENSRIYGQLTPPDYDLKQITAPMAFFKSQNDWLADPDVNI